LGLGRRDRGNDWANGCRRQSGCPKLVEIGENPLNRDFSRLDRIEARTAPQRPQRVDPRRADAWRKRRVEAQFAQLRPDRLPGVSGTQHVPRISRDRAAPRPPRTTPATPLPGSATKKITNATTPPPTPPTP